MYKVPKLSVYTEYWWYNLLRLICHKGNSVCQGNLSWRDQEWCKVYFFVFGSQCIVLERTTRKSRTRAVVWCDRGLFKIHSFLKPFVNILFDGLYVKDKYCMVSLTLYCENIKIVFNILTTVSIISGRFYRTKSNLTKY